MRRAVLPEKLVFVDIETSGTRVTGDRVIEVGIVRVENGEVTQTYQSLINPETTINPYITQFTGIKQDDLVDAPVFETIAGDIYDLMAGCIFVAHNVRFDYGFLKNEFARLGMDFSPEHFCTVKLSRTLFPQERHHNLSAIIERFGLNCPNRHRPLGDAEVTWQFYQGLTSQFSEAVMAEAVKKALRRPSLPSQLNSHQLAKLPTTPGVYIFYDSNKYPLYVGKSKNIRERVLSHFANDYAASKEMAIAQQVKDIETIETAGELGALLKESQLVKEMQPLYNRMLRHSRQMAIVTKSENKDGYLTTAIETVTSLTTDMIPSVIGVFKSRKQAKEFLITVAKKQYLCHKLLNVEKSSHSCFPYQLGWCYGACVGKEPAEKYNLRCLMAFAGTSLKPWPFPGPVVIEEVSEDQTKREDFVIDKWCLIATVNDETTLPELTSSSYDFDLDTYKILCRYILQTSNQKFIRPYQAVIAT